MTGAVEAWVDLPGYDQRVSSLGVVVGKKGNILTPYKRPSGLTLYNLSGPAGRKTASIFLIMELAGFWNPADRFGDRYTPADDAVIRLAGSLGDAMARLPGRTAASVKSRKRELGGVKWARQTTSPREWGRDLYAKVRAACPNGLPPDVRDDLVQDVAVMVMEGFTGQLRDAYRQASRARNRVFGTWHEVSAHRYVGGGSSGRTFLDTFVAGSSL